MDPYCTIELLGGLRVRLGKRTITRFRTQKTAALLAHLAYHLDRLHPREVLIEMLWPEAPSQEAGRKSLSVALSSLRSVLEPPGIAPQSVLTADAQRVGLRRAVVTTDVAEFESWLDHADRAETDAGRYELLNKAVSLFSAPLLPGYYEDWIVPAQERLAARYFTALRTLTRGSETRGDLLAAADYARQAVVADPLNEEAAHDLIRLLIASGQTSKAVHQYNELVRIIEAEIGGRPPSRTRDLVAPVLATTPHQTTCSSRAFRRGGHGSPLAVEHKPVVDRGGATPSQSCMAEGLPADAVPTPLPIPPTLFFGRELELARLRCLLGTPSTRLVTLTGPGGVGKTRLAITASEEVRRRWGDLECNAASLPSSGTSKPQRRTVYFAALASLSDARLLPATLHDALGLAHHSPGAALTALQQPGSDPLAMVVAALAAAPYPPLLVLDNFEHLVEDGTPLIETLLDRVPALTCLVTSRQRLLLAGEHEVPVAPLPVPTPPLASATSESQDAAASVLAPEMLLRDWASITLFVDRAQLARPDFQITRRNAPAIVDLVVRLDGLPLAIELAAARAQVLTPHQMVTHLERRFDFLVSRHRGRVEERQRSLWTTIAWSVALLAPDLRRLFACLSVFRGGWTLEDAQAALCPEHDAGVLTLAVPLLDALAQLCDASLVRAVEKEDHEVLRFHMLETLREFAAAQLRYDEWAELQRRHATVYLALGEQAEPHLQGSGQSWWLNRLGADHDNLCAALDWAETSPTPEGARTQLRLAGALHRFWLVRGHLNEGRRHLRIALEQHRMCAASEEATISAMASDAKVYNGAGILAMTQGDLGEAAACFQESLALQRSLQDPHGLCAVLNNLAIVECQQGIYDQARVRYAECLERWRVLGDQRNVAVVLANLARIAIEQNDLTQAEHLFTEGLCLARQVGDTRGQASRMRNLGMILYRHGAYDAATRLCRDSLVLSQSLEDALGVAYTLMSLALLAAAQGCHLRAERLFGASLVGFDRLGVPVPEFEHGEMARRAAGANTSATACAAARDEGRTMDPARAVLYALAEDDQHVNNSVAMLAVA